MDLTHVQKQEATKLQRWHFLKNCGFINLTQMTTQQGTLERQVQTGMLEETITA